MDGPDAMILELEAEGIADRRVLDAMRKVRREYFVPARFRSQAYANRPLPIGSGQTISQPYIVAKMTEALALQPEDCCLEIGTGSGYQTAIVAELCKAVHTIEYVPEVARFGHENLRSQGYGPDRVVLRVGDGYQGWPEAAPFPAIIVTAAPDRVPRPLLEQLSLGGRLVIPLGAEDETQWLETWTRIAPGNAESCFERRRLVAVRFVPFVHEQPLAKH
jgi:protein-L-isoaspartate(D-aspartate) O-methyltransferase